MSLTRICLMLCFVLSGHLAGAIKEQFVALERANIELQRAIRVCRQARGVVRSLINNTYGYPPDETPTSGNSAEQRVQDTTDDSGSDRLCPSLRKGNDGENCRHPGK